MKLTVRLTARHIVNGKPKNPQLCAVALALRELIRDDWLVGAGYSGCFAYERNSSTAFKDQISFEVSAEVKRWMRDFDDEKSCHPIEFEVDLPEKVLKI